MRSTISRVLGALVLLLVVALGLPAQPALGQSDTAPSLTTGGTISYVPGDGAVLVDPDLTITGSDDATLDAAVVSIGAGFLPTDDTLGISGQAGTAGTVNGLSWSYDAASGMMTLTGEATLGDYEDALRQVTYSNSSPTMKTDRSVSISLGSVMYNFENGHFYEFVSAPRISWTDAQEAAEARTYAGLQGYLVTLTSAEENDLVTDKLPGSGWIGASDDGHDKEWYWETGPEAGMHFFTQATDENGCGKGSAETQPPGDNFENWDIGPPEPNDFPAGCTDSENYANISADGTWNDWPNSGAARAFGYVVEYGGIEGEPADAPIGTILIQADAPLITIEKIWVGDDPDMAISFTVVPEVDGCTAEQTVSLPAAEASVDVSVAAGAGETACTYKVTESAPVGYTASPDEVTAVAVDGTAAFTNTPTPVDALPRTGSTNSALVILGLVLAGSGWFVLGGGRRRHAFSAIDEDEPVDLLPGTDWTQQPVGVAADVPTPAAPADDDAVPGAGHGPTGSAFVDAVLMREPHPADDDAVPGAGHGPTGSAFVDVVGMREPSC